VNIFPKILTWKVSGNFFALMHLQVSDKFTLTQCFRKTT
jgi:hypothetical protein